MTRNSWVSAVALCGSPPAFVVTVLMLGCLWVVTSEIAWAAHGLPYGADAAAVLFACFNAPLAAWLFANYLSLKHDLRELHIPRRRGVQARSLGLFVTLMVVAPCLLVLSWSAGLLVVALVALSGVVGMAGTLLWAAAAGRRSADHHVRSTDSQALRTVLEAPYAPASWQTRLLQLTVVAIALFAAPVLVIAFGRSLSSRTFARLMHAAEFLGFAVALAMCWVWPLSRALALFNPARGALTELALLPGLGDNAVRRRRLYRVVIGPPALALLILWLIATGAAWLERPPDDTYIRLVVAFLIVPLFTLPIILGQIAQPRPGAGGLVIASAMFGPLCGLVPALWNLPLEAFSALPSLLHWLVVGIAMLLLFFCGHSFISLRNVAQRPHPFVDVS